MIFERKKLIFRVFLVYNTKTLNIFERSRNVFLIKKIREKLAQKKI